MIQIFNREGKLIFEIEYENKYTIQKIKTTYR